MSLTPTAAQLQAFKHLTNKRASTPHERAKALAASPQLSAPDVELVDETSSVFVSFACPVFQCLEITLRADGTYDVTAIGG